MTKIKIVKCVVCGARCLTRKTLWNEDVCLYCYTKIQDFLIKKWKRLFHTTDINATIEVPAIGV